MNWVFLGFVFVMGLCVGSFVNVLIWRTLHGLSPYRGRSACDRCGRRLAWYENIPVLSYVVLRGRCRTCKKKIDWSYPVVEGVTGLLFLWWASLGFAFFQLTQTPLSVVQPAFWLIIGLVLVVVFFADLIYGIIPDFTVVLLGLVTLVYRLMLMKNGALAISDFVEAVVVGLIGGSFFLLLYLVTRGKGMGFGDVKYALVMGFLLGYPKGLVGMFVSFVMGGVVGVGLLITGKRKMKARVPFGPFLVGGTLIGLVWGNQLWWMYWNSF